MQSIVRRIGAPKSSTPDEIASATQGALTISDIKGVFNESASKLGVRDCKVCDGHLYFHPATFEIYPTVAIHDLPAHCLRSHWAGPAVWLTDCLIARRTFRVGEQVQPVSAGELCTMPLQARS